MGSIPARVHDRIVSGLKTFQPVIASAKSRDVNESDTVTITVDMLSGIFGYDKYSEITSEHSIRGTYCDLAIKVDAKLELLVEVKAVGSVLKDSHIKQAIDYAANQGVEWVILTNAVSWKVYRVHFTKPIDQELVLDLDITQLNPRSSDHIESLFLLSREAIIKSSLIEYHAQRQAMNRYALAAVLLSEPIVSTIRRELRRITPGVRIEMEEIRASLLGEVLKREVVEGEKADEARRKLNKVQAKVRRAAAGAGTSEASSPSAESEESESPE